MNSVHQPRRKKFYQHLNDGEALILFAGSAPRKTADAHYRFFANRNFFYLTGVTQSESIFLAVKSSEGIRESLFIHPKDVLAERWNGARISTSDATESSGITDVRQIDVFEETLTEIASSGHINTLWYDFDRFDTESLDAPQNRHSRSILERFPTLKTENAYPLLCIERTVKDANEIAHIREAMALTRDGIHAMMKAVKPGMHEYQLESVFNQVLAHQGIREPAFASIVSGGKNNFYLHYEEPTGQFRSGDLVLTDVGARVNEYVADISRAFPVNGRFSDEQKKIYSIALQINKELMALLVPHKTTFEEIEAYSRRRVAEELIAAGYLGKDEDVSKYYWHKGTHHIGLDVHDVGPPGTPILPGMCFTIDVGIYLEDRGIGFRVEDNVAITETGYENLSADIVREIDEIEAMMTHP